MKNCRKKAFKKNVRISNLVRLALDSVEKGQAEFTKVKVLSKKRETRMSVTM